MILNNFHKFVKNLNKNQKKVYLGKHFAKDLGQLGTCGQHSLDLVADIGQLFVVVFPWLS